MAAIFQMTRATAAIRRPGDLTPAGPPTTAQSPLRERTGGDLGPNSSKMYDHNP
jgi:hypothetical protein